MDSDRVAGILTLIVVGLLSAWMATVSLSLEQINDKLDAALEKTRDTE